MQNWVPRQGRTEPPQQQQRASEHTDHVHPSMAMVATAATVCVASPSSLFSAGASSRECGRRGSSSRVQGVRPSISSRVQGAPLVRQSPLRLSISSRRRSREWRWQSEGSLLEASNAKLTRALEGVEGVSNDDIDSPSDGTAAVKSELTERGWTPGPSPAFSQWDTATASLAESATAAFLLLQLPQIILNTQNLLAGNQGALFAVTWMGQLTGLLGNLSLLSYFASKKERGAMIVQAVGVVSTLVVLSQLAIAGAMPGAVFTVTASVVVVGLVLNLLNYNNKLNPELWRVWGEAVTIGGVTVLPQVMWSTFEPYVPSSTLPGTVFGVLAVSVIVLARLGKLPAKAKSIIGSVSAWTATLLFMWAPVAQWWQNYLFPANIRGLSVFTVLLAMIGNSLLLPRALFTRDLMWCIGSSWGTLLQGWGILVSMYLAQVISSVTFYGVTGVLFLWLSVILWRDSKAYDLSSPLAPLLELVSGKRLS